MGNDISVIRLFQVASAVAIGLLAGCSGSSGDGSSGSGSADTQPAQDASAQGQTAPAGSASVSAAPPGSASRSGAAPDGGNTPSPKQCASEQDCTGACPTEAKGCTCADAPDGNKRCIATCTADQDCPAGPGGALVCSAQKICVPKS